MTSEKGNFRNFVEECRLPNKSTGSIHNTNIEKQCYIQSLATLEFCSIICKTVVHSLSESHTD